jgi:hypothetical protein
MVSWSSLKQQSVGRHIATLTLICFQDNQSLLLTIFSACLKFVRLWVKPWSGQIKDYKTGIFCFSNKHAALTSKSKDWLSWKQINVSVAICLPKDWLSWNQFFYRNFLLFFWNIKRYRRGYCLENKKYQIYWIWYQSLIYWIWRQSFIM